MAALSDQRHLWDLKAIQLYAGISRASSYRLVSQEDFPKAIRIPGMNPKWFAEEVKDYFRAQQAA
jgi:predicted DNA-binding transcriptional regulator AlpA